MPATPFPSGSSRAAARKHRRTHQRHRQGHLNHPFVVHPRGRPADAALHWPTRDGTFYIENGANQAPRQEHALQREPLIMLNNLEAIGRPQRLAGCLVPPLKIRDFTFTSLSDAV
ncbi:MAG: hypothetical protein WKG07_16070 [Hymenobacter sp.]